MDKADKKLMEILQEDARTPLNRMADAVFLSAPAAAARIKRLKKQGYITGYHASISNKKLGFPVTAYINVEVVPAQKPEFYPFVRSCPNVLECSCVTGNYSMLLKVAFESTESLDGFINKLQSFGATQTQIVFSQVVEPRDVQVADMELSEV